jgi:hypothetical protein
VGKADQPCPYCPLRFMNAAHRSKHISRKHATEHKVAQLLKKAKVPTSLRSVSGVGRSSNRNSFVKMKQYCDSVWCTELPVTSIRFHTCDPNVFVQPRF